MNAVWKRVIRSVGISFVLGIAVCATAWFLARSLPPMTAPALRWAQVAGGFLAFWAALARVGWSIQTWDGNTLPEVFELWFFRVTTIVGTMVLLTAVLAEPRGG